jgi:hypothetical protein
MGFGGVWDEYMKINFRLGQNAHQARPGEILKFGPMKTSVVPCIPNLTSEKI